MSLFLPDLNMMMRICSFPKKWGWNGQLQVMGEGQCEWVKGFSCDLLFLLFLSRVTLVIQTRIVVPAKAET
jgi:hypothetical protein